MNCRQQSPFPFEQHREDKTIVYLDNDLRLDINDNMIKEADSIILRQGATVYF